MRGHMLRKIIFTSFLVCAVAGLQNVAFSKKSNASQSDIALALSLEKKLINDALDEFKKAIENKGGHIERMSCKFKLYKNEAIETNTKVYYLDYHKRPDFYAQRMESFSDAQQPDFEVEVVYLKSSKHLSFIQKEGKSKTTKYVSLPETFMA